jgi:hypothetical protein
MYIAHGKKEPAAHELLQEVIKMSRDDASIDEKAEAASLLRKLRGSIAHNRKKSVIRPSRERPKSESREPRGAATEENLANDGNTFFADLQDDLVVISAEISQAFL